jgi:hypothetical protein
MSSSTVSKRKRKRDHSVATSAASRLLLPEIPGIPMEVLPLHMHAIRVTTQWFRKQQTATAATFVVPPYEQSSKQKQEDDDDDDDDLMVAVATRNSETRERSVMDAIWNRIEVGGASASGASESDSLRQQQQQQQQRKSQAVHDWLQAIRRYCCEDARRTMTTRTESHVENNTELSVACLRHLLPIGRCDPKQNSQQPQPQPQSSFALLRANTHLAGHLLEKSADARRCFCMELLRWMDRVLVAADENGDDHHENENIRAIWQQESFLLLQHLQNKFGHLYPTLSTAVQRFQQLRPEISTSSSMESHDSQMTTTTATTVAVISSSRMSMVERRKIRDLAIQYAKQEHQQVRKLLKQAYACTDILFPSVTHDIIANTGKDHHKDDDDDDSVDWEDGCKHNGCSQTSQVSHGDAVEHTLAAMEFTGKLKNGELEIDLAEETQHRLITDGEKQSDAYQRQARERFESVVNKLAKKHMPRLMKWVDALHQADSLVEVQPRKTSVAASAVIVGEPEKAPASLVRMSASQAQEIASITQQLVDLKQEVASVLSSAKRMGLELQVDSLNHGVPPQPRAFRIVRERILDFPPTSRQSMASLQSRARKNHHSNRIQIKYRKNH